jgi:hypothetical protein
VREVVVLVVVVVVCVVVVCGFRTSSRCMWMSAIVPLFLQVFETSACRGGSAKIFNWQYYFSFFFAEKSP